MKKKTRKISSKVIALIVMMTISLALITGISTTYAETESVSGYELLLNRIGISAEYDENAYITRGDFAILAVQSLKVESYEGESFFTDVSGEQGAYINTAVRLGIVSQNDSGLFYPDRIITLNEATAMCIRLLGYGEILNTPDAYPTKYVAQANKLRLYEGLSSGQEVTGADAAKLIFNTLDSNYIEEVIYRNGQDNTFTLSDSTYLAERFNVNKRTGIVTAINETALNGHSSVDREYMTIDSRKYLNPYYSGFGYYTYLGRRVDYYTMETDGEIEVVYIKDRSQPQIVNFTDVTKVIGFNSGDSATDRKTPKLTYKTDSGKHETLNIKADATILVNGEKKLVITNEDFDLPSGQITLIDRDSDKVYDVVAIEQHTYCRVDYFDPTTGKLEVEEGTIFIEASDNGTLARVGFSCSEGSVFVNDVTAKSLSANNGLEVKKISYKNSSAKAVNAPSAGGKVTSVEVSNTLTSQPAVVFVAVYGADGSMVDFEKATYDSLPTGKTTVTFTDVDIPSTWNSNCEVKAFVWNSTSKIVPLTDTHGEKLLPTIYITGDSTAADYGTESYPYTGWGTEFKSIINENIDVVNMAQADASTSDIISGGQLAEIAKRILPGDYLFIASSYDDAAEGISEATYKANLKTIAATATENGAKVVFVTSPAPQSKDISTYVSAMKAVASELDAPVLDLNTAWAGFLADTDDDVTYYSKTIDAAMKSDSRWALSAQNSASGNYTASLTGKDGRLSPAGAQKAAALLASNLKSANLPISSYVETVSPFTYSVSGGVLTVNGSGNMPVYASFSETPWANATGVTTVKVSDGITSVSTDAFSGFTGLTEVYLPDSVVSIGNGAFPASGFTIYGSNNTVGQRYAEVDSSIDFAFKTFRILAIGNSHTHDYMNWRDLVFADLKNAGLKTEIVFDYALVGGAQLMYKDIPYVGVEGEYRSHYVQGSNPNRAYYNTYSKLRENTYDLVLIQDYCESVYDQYRYTFANDLTKVVRWIRNEQPNADIAWVADWTAVNSTGARERLYDQWITNCVPVMNNVSALEDDRPDFIVPMNTALQNARTSYLGGVYNAADCYGDNSNTDWNGTNGITSFTILERDGTHCSYELGRYLVSAAVFGKVFDEYKDSMEGFDFDFFSVLSTTPEYVTNSIYPWNGSITDNHMAIIRESAKNAILYPTEVKQSAYTVDPADGIATSVAGLNYPTFTAAGIASTVNSANLGITISASDVTVSGDSANVTFLHGYTKKTVTVTK